MTTHDRQKMDAYGFLCFAAGAAFAVLASLAFANTRAEALDSLRCDGQLMPVIIVNHAAHEIRINASPIPNLYMLEREAGIYKMPLAANGGVQACIPSSFTQWDLWEGKP